MTHVQPTCLSVCLTDCLPVCLPSESSLRAVLHQSVFLSALSPQPGRDLSLCWEQHRKLLPGVAGETADSVRTWSVQQVGATPPPLCLSSPLSLCLHHISLSLCLSLSHLSLSSSLSVSHLFVSLSRSLSMSLGHLSVSQQVADFVESLPGCEDQSQQFRDEVS